jgi:hypothetical protein
MTKEINFARPPVTEVVLGVSFDRLPGFRIAHFGKFWQLLIPEYSESLDASKNPCVTRALMIHCVRNGEGVDHGAGTGAV